jgi:hypothetical protein
MNQQFLEQLAILAAVGSRRGYVLFEEIDRLLPDEYSGGPEIDEIFVQLAAANIDVRESPDRRFSVEPLKYGDDLNDAVNVYVREACTVPRLTPEQEIVLARRGALKDLVEADQFDPERGFPFTIYAVWHIRRAIQSVPLPAPLFYPHKQIQ